MALLLGGFLMAAGAFAQETAEPEKQQVVDDDPEADVSADPESGDESEEERRARLRRLRMGNFAQATLNGKEVSIRYGNLPVDGPDFELFKTVKPGEVAKFTRTQAVKLKTQPSLQFGDVLVHTENVATDYPGVYSLWLKNTEEGWFLVFNELPDVWGTMYHERANIGEVPLKTETPDEPAGKFTIKIEKQDENHAILKLAWGEHAWSTSFSVPEAESE